MADTHEADDNEQAVIACCRLADDGFGDPRPARARPPGLSAVEHRVDL